jgi:glyoxylase-like metal-dependent hydrolase (beta-lactamase superfamily II)
MTPKPLLLGLTLALAVETWPGAQQNISDIQLDVVPVRGNVYMLAGAGGNVTLQVGQDGALLVDTALAPAAPRIMAEIQKLTRGPLLYIVNTHVHPDHVGGNEAFAKMSPQLTVGPNGLTGGQRTLRIIAHESVLHRMSKPAGNAPAPELGLPQDGFFTPFKDLRFNGEAIFVYHQPNAHTDGDSIVLFRGSDVVSTGDIFTPGRYPFIDIERGGSVQGEIDALNRILEFTVPARTQEGGTYVIPGHGRVCDEADVVEFRDMVVIIRDRVRDMVNKGMTLEQVKAAKPTRDYDPAYVSSNSLVSADRFVESIYQSLKK